jgi:hypothetical protein
MTAKERLFELIIEYAATHPHRDWTIGIKPYSDIPMEQARKENLEHWSLLSDSILKEFVRREDIGIEVKEWINEDELTEEIMYDALFPLSKVDIVRMFPKTIVVKEELK